MILLRRCCTLIIVKNSATHIYRGFCNHCNLFSIVTYTSCYEVITGFSLFLCVCVFCCWVSFGFVDLFIFFFNFSVFCFERTPTLFFFFFSFQASLQIVFSPWAVSEKWNILSVKLVSCCWAEEAQADVVLMKLKEKCWVTCPTEWQTLDGPEVFSILEPFLTSLAQLTH